VLLLLLSADQHLESSTKRTLVENETMAAELAYHTAQVGGVGARTQPFQLLALLADAALPGAPAPRAAALAVSEP
jgi:hypothetical protein